MLNYVFFYSKLESKFDSLSHFDNYVINDLFNKNDDFSNFTNINTNKGNKIQNIYKIYLDYLKKISINKPKCSKFFYTKYKDEKYVLIKTKVYEIPNVINEELKDKCIYICHLMNLSVEDDIEVFVKYNVFGIPILSFMKSGQKIIYNYYDNINQYLFFPKNYQKVEDSIIICYSKVVPFGENLSISSNYGVRLHPIKKRKTFHSGVDLENRENRNCLISSIADGIVESTAYRKDYGNHVIINHGNNIKSLYAHMHKILIKEGATIKFGDVIGIVGSTGYSTGPHLHLEFRKNEQRLNPNKLIIEKKRETNKYTSVKFMFFKIFIDNIYNSMNK